jgi:CheY-like chemotaxis protein
VALGGRNRSEEVMHVTRTAVCPTCTLAQPVDVADLGAEVLCRNCGGRIRAEAAPHDAFRPVTVLWIDDDRLLLTFGRDILERHGYRVLTAPDGLAGLAIAEQERYDLIILDVVMPDMTGYEVCRQLRAVPGLRETPILLLTSLQDPQVDVLGRGIGETFTMSKPADPETIVHVVEQILGRRSASLPS